MRVSCVVIAIAAALGAVATVFGGIHALLIRFERRLEARFLSIDARCDMVDARFDRVDAHFEQIEGEIVEMKVSLAPIEGTHRTLLGLNAR